MLKLEAPKLVNRPAGRGLYDVDDKGGAAISVSYILQRPILYLGTGQTYDDLKEFDSGMIIESLGL